MIINNCLASPTASRADCQLRAADTIKAPPGAASPRGVLTTPTPLHSPAGLRPNLTWSPVDARYFAELQNKGVVFNGFGLVWMRRRTH